MISEGWLGDIAFRQGRWAEAETTLKRTLQRASEQGDRRCLALCQQTLAEVAHAQGSDRRASSLALKAFYGFRRLEMTLEADQMIQFMKRLSYRPANLDFLLERDLELD